MLTFIRTIHSVIFVVMATSVFYIDYCGVVGQSGVILNIAIGLIMFESIVFVGNGLKCPLTALAKQNGATKGYVFDSFFPEKWTRYTFPVFGSLLLVGLILVALRWQKVL